MKIFHSIIVIRNLKKAKKCDKSTSLDCGGKNEEEISLSEEYPENYKKVFIIKNIFYLNIFFNHFQYTLCFYHHYF